MSSTATPRPAWKWNSVGRSFTRPKNDRRDPRRPKYVTHMNGKVSGIMTVTKVPRAIDTFEIEATVYHGDGEVFIKKRLTGAQLAAFADVPDRDLDPSDHEYAFAYGADHAVPGKFARNGNEAVFPNPGTGKRGDAVFYLQIKKFFSEEMDRMIRAGRAHD
ncbi:MAG TPA: hypothetical protein VFQ72_01550 [Candidatus Paceibacterota bacterium]|nr:hypothetical protein [Candidatus Paceibacterota bacterium]